MPLVFTIVRVLTSGSIKQHARDIGFDLCGIAPAAAFPELSFLRQWIDAGYAGTMAYLPRTAERRGDVRRVMPSAKSVIVAGAVYNTGHSYSTERNDGRYGEVARYAWSEDYHQTLSVRLESLIAWMREHHDEPFEARAYVDTGPVQERVYAQYAGLGWIGKNTCLINTAAGSWVLLGVVICSLPLEHDTPAVDQCGTCRLCLEACPTSAFAAPYVLDATRCISYLTIEYRGAVPEQHREALGNHLFGCDVCQEVCPWNGAPLPTPDSSWSSRADLNLASVVDMWRRTDAELAASIDRTPLTRAGVRGLRRNLAVALGNSSDPAALTALSEEPGADRDTAADPLVVEHVEWAKRKLQLKHSHPDSDNYSG